jgi:hypothetical protein
MTEINNLNVSLSSRYHSKLSQVRHLIDETKKEQSVKNLEAKRSHDEQADVLLEHWLNQKVDEQLESIGLNILSKHEQFNRSLDELIKDLSKNESSRQKMIKLFVNLLLEVSVGKVYFFPCLLLVTLIRLASNYYDDRQTIFKISNSLLSEDAQAVLEVMITRELKISRSPLRQKIMIFCLFSDIFWGSKVVPYFQDKLIPNRKEVD